MNQTDMFSVFDDCERARSRNSDPSTSHEAAQELVSSGKLDRQCQVVLHALGHVDGGTSAEIGHLVGDRYMAARRLPDLERKGFVRRGDIRKCRQTGNKATTWWLK